MASGSISPSGAISVPDGGTVTFFMTHKKGLFDISTPTGEWVVDGILVPGGDSYTFTNVVSDHTIVANYNV